MFVCYNYDIYECDLINLGGVLKGKGGRGEAGDDLPVVIPYFIFFLKLY